MLRGLFNTDSEIYKAIKNQKACGKVNIFPPGTRQILVNEWDDKLSLGVIKIIQKYGPITFMGIGLRTGWSYQSIRNEIQRLQHCKRLKPHIIIDKIIVNGRKQNTYNFSDTIKKLTPIEVLQEYAKNGGWKFGGHDPEPKDPKGPNSHERKLQKILDLNFKGLFRYTGKGDFFVGSRNKNPDFMEYTNVFALNYNSTLYHSEASKKNPPDVLELKERKYYLDHGIKLVIIWEPELDIGSNVIVPKVKALLDNGIWEKSNYWLPSKTR